MKQEDPECVFRSQSFHEAAIVREMLDAAGVPAFLFDSNATGSAALFGPAVMFRVMVSASSKDAALKLIAEKEEK
ncbi:MAG: hypothetical protein FD189_1482 [Elusimicrobia bacterium]|nr:MAG: hypothetical protein FD154_1370 [Elusimicrobiota bacterium]KAF0155248.1 MAG: hypothetical protein FD189_1482 [Elusimicrobiota bacterium]